MQLKDRDNSIPAEQRGTPRQMRVLRVDLSSATLKTITIPYDIKVCTIRSPVAAELSLAKNDGSSVTPADLTGGNDARKLPLEGGVREPIAQEDEFNTLYILPSTTSADELLVWLGDGSENDLTGAGYVGA